MSLFLALMIIGLTGLVVMAIPFLGRHGHGHAASHSLSHAGHGTMHIGHGHGAGHVGPAGSGHAAAHGAGTHSAAQGKEAAAGNAPGGLARLMPSPRAIFSFLALYGAFGNALVEMGHLPIWMAGLLALLPAFLLERYAVTPLWNLLLRFQARPSSPIETLVLEKATAVTAFHNGKGLVSVVRDGRSVQFRAQLADEHAAMPVRVGDELHIEDVDAANERLTVRLQ
jgi:hypothetical protein